MPNRDAFQWFKSTFHSQIEPALTGTPFSLDLLTAIAAQETGHIWGSLHSTLDVDTLLEICVGDTLDADKGRKAFPKTRDDLIAANRGEDMFRIAHDALVAMAVHVPSFAGVAKRPAKFCHGYGIFQYDLQFFKDDPDYFLNREWRLFERSLDKAIEELTSAMSRMDIAGQDTLSDLEQVHVAIAYNSGSFKPAKGLKQGFFDGEKFYGEMIFDFLRLSQTVSIPAAPSALPAPPPGVAPIARPTPIVSTGRVLEVDVRDTPLRLRSEPRIDRANPSSNVIARLPDGHRVRLVSGVLGDRFVEVETSLNGAHLEGFAASEFLVPVEGDGNIPVVVPAAALPTSGVVAVFAPRRQGTMTTRRAPATALSLNESDQPGRNGTTPEALREEISEIIDYLDVEKAAHVRYQPADGRTFCNIYAHDFCTLAGVYLPRVWWTGDAIERLARGESVEPRLGATIDEQRANDLFRWLRSFGPRFGWRQTGTLTKLQTEANIGAVGLIVARRVEDGRPGHITVVIPESSDFSAKRDSSGEVIAPLQSQAGATNFERGTGSLNWWKKETFADSAFWIHA
ncbi:MAG TPA: hypothetical protein VH436_06035 [Vicinamibacterales bacterium]